jgi:hypothetical protein
MDFDVEENKLVIKATEEAGGTAFISKLTT